MLSGLVATAGIQGFGIVATLLFVGIFLTAVLRVLTSSRAELERQAGLPLDDGVPCQTTRCEGGS